MYTVNIHDLTYLATWRLHAIVVPRFLVETHGKLLGTREVPTEAHVGGLVEFRDDTDTCEEPDSLADLNALH